MRQIKLIKPYKTDLFLMYKTKEQCGKISGGKKYYKVRHDGEKYMAEHIAHSTALKKSGYKTNALKHITAFIKNNIVFVIAVALAAITSIIVPPDKNYLGYFDLKTLTCLFCTLAVVCALKNIKFFTIIAQKIVAYAGNTRTAAIMLVYITFIGSMLIANDMALLTFLPLGFYVFSSSHQDKYMVFVFIMQNIAANLGGMLTPFGNPQNLFLYEKFAIPNGEFVSIMFPPFLVSIILITVCCLFIKKENMAVDECEYEPLPKAKTALYLVMFVFSILLVFRIVPFYIGLILIPLILLFVDNKALALVDYPLLLTFAAFFIFAGNMSRIGVIQRFFEFLLSQNTLVVSALSCQFISNVPSAILLSQFTQNYADLLIGVNIGGAGTLIASLASLITFREYTLHYKSKTLYYILMFSAFNFGFLIILLLFCSFVI